MMPRYSVRARDVTVIPGFKPLTGFLAMWPYSSWTIFSSCLIVLAFLDFAGGCLDQLVPCTGERCCVYVFASICGVQGLIWKLVSCTCEMLTTVHQHKLSVVPTLAHQPRRLKTRNSLRTWWLTSITAVYSNLLDIVFEGTSLLRYYCTEVVQSTPARFIAIPVMCDAVAFSLIASG